MAKEQNMHMGGKACSLFCMSLSETCDFRTRECVHLLSQVVRAEKVDNLATTQEQLSQAARIRYQECVAAQFMGQHGQTAFKLKEHVLQLLVHAVQHSMTLIVTEAAAAASVLVLHMKATGSSVLSLVEDLLSNCRTLLTYLRQSDNTEDSLLHEQLLQLISSDLLPMLTAYTGEVVAHLIQELAAVAAAAAEKNTEQSQQEYQQQHSEDVSMRNHQDDQILKLQQQHTYAAKHAADVITTWYMLLAQLQATREKVLQHIPGLVPAFRAAVHLTATAAPLLHKGLLLSTESCKPSSGVHKVEDHLPEFTDSERTQAALRRALRNLVDDSFDFCNIIAPVLSNITGALPASERRGRLCWQQLQLQRQLLLIDKLPELMLLTIANQAAAYTLHAVSTAEALAENDHTLGHSLTAAQQQQQRWRQQQQGIYNSHNVILTSLGLPADIVRPLEPDAVKHDSFYNSGTCRCAVWVLRSILLREVHAGGNSSSTNSSVGCKLDAVFPQRLILPTVRLLIQSLLLAPADAIHICVDSIQLLLLLLGLLAEGQPPSSPSAAAVDSEEAEKPSTTAAAKLWLPQLPAAVAAGLLHPVVQQLSRVVMQALKKTESPKQQQQQQRQQLNSRTIPPAHTDQDAERLTLLRSFGEVLMTVCQSVEPKHIAAALRSDDPVIPLVAIEAVIKAQASAPAAARQSNHQSADNSSNNISTHYPQPAVLLLPFIIKIVRAIQLLVKDLSPPISNHAAVNPLVISLRVFSLVTTACKVGTRATEQWVKYRKQQSQDAQQLPSTAGTATAAAAAMGSKEATEELTKWYMKAPPAIRDIAAELTTRMYHTSSSNSSSTSVNCSDTGVAGEFDQHQRSRGKNAKHGLQHRKGPKQAGCSSTAAASSADAMSSAQQQSGSCRVLPLVMLVQMMSASVAHLTAAHQCVKQSAETWAQHSASFVAENRIDDSETPATAAMLWPYAMVSTGSGTIFMALTGLMNGISLGLQSLPMQYSKEGSSNSVWQLSKQSIKQHLQRLHSLQQLSESIFKERIGSNILVRDVDGCPDLFTVTPSCFAADHLGKGNGTIGSGGLPSRNARKGGNRSSTTAEASDTSQTFDQQMASTYKQLNDFASSVLASLPAPFCCNNPSCVNLSKLSEYQLVSGKACVCGGCKVARYCSRECQKQHWKQHRTRCSQISRVS